MKTNFITIYTPSHRCSLCWQPSTLATRNIYCNKFRKNKVEKKQKTFHYFLPFKIWFQNRRAKCRRQEGPTKRGLVLPSTQTYKPPLHSLHSEPFAHQFSYSGFGTCMEHLCMCGHPSIHSTVSHVELMREVHRHTSIVDLRRRAMYHFDATT